MPPPAGLAATTAAEGAGAGAGVEVEVEFDANEKVELPPPPPPGASGATRVLFVEPALAAPWRFELCVIP